MENKEQNQEPIMVGTQNKTICLCAIMKNEEKILPRLIESCAPYIDYWVIVDTGSTDNSIVVLTDLMSKSKIPGELHQREWMNFSHNRNELLDLSLGKADYLLLMDCDMTIHPTKEFDKSKLTADAYHIRYTGGLDFAQHLFVSGRRKWYYVGVTHEYLATDGQYILEDLRSLPVTHHFDGGMRHEKLERDRKLLEQDILDNPDNARSFFYLAQTYNNAGFHEKAYKYYQQRINRGGWPEEVYYSMYQGGLMLSKMGKKAEAKEMLLKAWEYRPQRVEALYVLGMMARGERAYNQGALYLEKAYKTPYPENDLLFIHREVSNYLIQFDLAICLFYTNRIQEAKELNDYLINNKSIPEGIRNQARENQKFCHDKLGLPVDGQIKRDFLAVSFFTEGTKYRAEADKLAASCQKFKISHEIYQAPDFGSWEKNTQHKAIIIRDALIKHKKPVLWIDADAEFKAFPDIFFSTQADVMYHFIQEWKEILVGTLYFSYNDKVMEFIDKWITLNESNDKPDGINFQELIIKDTILLKELLPKEYCCIFDNPFTQCDQPVVFHTQASRRLKGEKPAEQTARYESVIDSLLEEKRIKFNDCYSIIGNGPFISDLTKEINNSFIMRCNDFKVGPKYKGIANRTNLNISSLYKDIIPTKKVSYPILGILPISNTGYQKYTTAPQMHVYWLENAVKLTKMDNQVLTYDEKDRFYHEVFLPIAEGIQAFPTVGILAIGLARWWRAKKIVVSGFTFFESEKSHYQHEKNTKPSNHHNVFHEKLLLRGWIETDSIDYVLDGLTREALYDFKKEKWEKVSQPFEINWHRTQPDWRADPVAWEGCKENLFKALPMNSDMLDGLEVLDIGSGPRSMLQFFPGCKGTLIEPLGEEYKTLVGHDYPNGFPLYSVAAEKFIPELENKFDFAWSHNVLDHCYDWKMVLENMFRYLKKGGKFYIATDAGFPPNDGHPGIESTKVFMKEINRYGCVFELEDIREPEDEHIRRQEKRANHQIRSINLIGQYTGKLK